MQIYPNAKDIPQVSPKELIELEGDFFPLLIRLCLGQVAEQDIARLLLRPPQVGFL